MIYLLSQKTSTFGMLSFDQDNPIDQDCISKGFRIGGLASPVKYTLKNRVFIRNAGRIHIVWSANGPTLVSTELRRVIETEAGNSVEFIPAVIADGSKGIEGYSVINVLSRQSCVDMSTSEYEQINFDPNDPRFSFTYTVLNDDFPCNGSIAVCAEQDNYIVVNDAIRAACRRESLKGLIFYRALDLTYEGRTVAEVIG